MKVNFISMRKMAQKRKTAARANTGSEKKVLVLSQKNDSVNDVSLVFIESLMV